MKCSYCGQKMSSWMEKCPYCEKPNDGKGDFIEPLTKKGSIGELFSFRGRYNRKMFFIFQLILFTVFFIFGTLLLRTLEVDRNSPIIGLSVFAIFICIFLNIASQAKRLHDINMTGWFVLLSFLLYLNLAFLIYLIFAKGTVGPNKFGPDPLAVKETETIPTI